jgi:type IV pilus assembly protein PilQ
VPLLGDLPLIGFLFANNKEEIQHSELVVFISPHIYKGEPLPEEQMAKFKELREKPLLSLPKDKEKKEK